MWIVLLFCVLYPLIITRPLLLLSRLSRDGYVRVSEGGGGGEKRWESCQSQ